ncbi:hypothetical protein BD413DRAFT_208420 [Trametes elegans]|nr:hypothetical protein BD413DRAFT_208420 [Trametes elegans]
MATTASLRSVTTKQCLSAFCMSRSYRNMSPLELSRAAKEKHLSLLPCQATSRIPPVWSRKCVLSQSVGNHPRVYSDLCCFSLRRWCRLDKGRTSIQPCYAERIAGMSGKPSPATTLIHFSSQTRHNEWKPFSYCPRSRLSDITIEDPLTPRGDTGGRRVAGSPDGCSQPIINGSSTCPIPDVFRRIPPIARVPRREFQTVVMGNSVLVLAD